MRKNLYRVSIHDTDSSKVLRDEDKIEALERSKIEALERSKIDSSPKLVREKSKTIVRGIMVLDNWDYAGI